MYRPRSPRASALYQCANRHAPECGDPQHGFARIDCDQCRHACILAFSCKARYFCPSCHQQRVLAYGEWVESNVLAPVPHRQYVFTLPRLLRPISARRRVLPGKLCGCPKLREENRALGEHLGVTLPARPIGGSKDAQCGLTTLFSLPRRS
jgi:transposase-like protein